MWMDVVDLRDFYDTAQGRVAQRMIRRAIRDVWPDVKGLRVMGLGYATPYLGLFRAEAERTVAFMPAAQGVVRWPSGGGSLTALVDECALPMPDTTFDRVLLVHALECAESLRPLLREAWRVLAPGGRLLVVAPNRTGLWARFETTPFGHGHPYSMDQLSRLLRETLFTPEARSRALYVPPGRSRMMLAGAAAWERLGVRWFPAVGGVVLVEASKQIYAQTGAPAVKRKLYFPVPGKLAGPRHGGTGRQREKSASGD